MINEFCFICFLRINEVLFKQKEAVHDIGKGTGSRHD
jgi:hypothetical protein